MNAEHAPIRLIPYVYAAGADYALLSLFVRDFGYRAPQRRGASGPVNDLQEHILTMARELRKRGHPPTHPRPSRRHPCAFRGRMRISQDGTLSPADAHGDHEEQGDHEVADHRRGRDEQSDDNEQPISA